MDLRAERREDWPPRLAERAALLDEIEDGGRLDLVVAAHRLNTSSGAQWKWLREKWQSTLVTRARWIRAQRAKG